MSASIEPQQPPPPPPIEVIEQAYTAHSGHGSIGPVIAVLAVITILGAIAVVIGRLCSGRRIMGHGQYDFEGWVEAKCGSCINGRVDPPPPHPPPPPPPRSSSGAVGCGDAVAAVVSAEAPREAKDEGVTRQHNPSESAGS
ncbi:uncharacterized protein LOC114301300 [Camellia sinensis]|uniref:uncharacterized protein LOC114301300 n=1 Tax=Camellia sinensis TaxID=4442 RepID=UPI001035B55C|nr:uncharacterized protein LOC114301300 [Camellia sinensis]